MEFVFWLTSQIKFCPIIHVVQKRNMQSISLYSGNVWMRVNMYFWITFRHETLYFFSEQVNYHFISRDGKPEESWEVLYYITHL